MLTLQECHDVLCVLKAPIQHPLEHLACQSANTAQQVHFPLSLDHQMSLIAKTARKSPIRRPLGHQIYQSVSTALQATILSAEQQYVCSVLQASPHQRHPQFAPVFPHVHWASMA